MQTNVLTKPNVSAEDFAGIPIHGRRMAASVIVVGILESLNHDFAREFLWEEGLPPVKERLYPCELVAMVFKQPIDVRWAIAAEICYGLADDEEEVA